MYEIAWQFRPGGRFNISALEVNAIPADALATEVARATSDMVLVV